jgi:SAM-dependent methyltransferase
MTEPITRQQPVQKEWEYQWARLWDDETWLFLDWIKPNKIEDFSGKTVLDAGCGPGHHTCTAAAHAAHVTALDLNTADIAREKLRNLPNVDIQEGDMATWDDGRRFDIVFSVGVIHHTSDPDRTVSHLLELLKPGGRLIVWVYSAEGNALNRFMLEPFKWLIVRHLPRALVMGLGHLLTLALYPFVYTIYLLPLPFLPFYEYFGNFRRIGYARNFCNVFDKLNAPTTHFISKPQAEHWVHGLRDATVESYVGVSWRISATKPE